MNYGTNTEVKSNKLFILDDATAFGVSEAKVRALTELFNGQPLVLNAGDLSKGLQKLIPEKASLVSIGNGGTLVYTLLSRYGFESPYIAVDVKRRYVYQVGEKRPKIVIEINKSGIDGSIRVSEILPWTNIILLDDVIASGMTINACIDYINSFHDSDYPKTENVAALVLSGDTRGKFRTEKGSTIRGVNDACAAQVVKGVAGFPAILSLRFVLTKAVEDQNLEYLFKYVSKNRESELKELVRGGIDASGLKLLYRDPFEFVRVNRKFR